MNKYSVCAVYRNTPDGRTALRFAADLHKHLGGKKLSVYVTGGSAEETALLAEKMATRSSGSAADVNLLQERNVLADVCSQTGLPESLIELAPAGKIGELQADAILVDHDGELGDFNLLVPFDEDGLVARGTGPILIPFGTDESGLRAAALGVPLAGLLGCEVVFYHTTWKDRAVTEPAPELHMCAKARRVGERLTALATAAGIKHRLIVETSKDVVLGTIHCAVREGANMIVMSREPKIIFGSYVDRALLQSVVPILIAGKARTNSEAKGSDELSEAERLDERRASGTSPERLQTRGSLP